MQGQLEDLTQQLQQHERDSKALVSVQLAEAEAAWNKAHEGSQQKLQDALHEIEVRMARGPIITVSCCRQLEELTIMP